VDGAGAVRRFVHITLPMLTPLIFFNLLLSTVNAFQAFTPAYVISGGEGGPLDSTLFYTLYLYQRGFANLEMGYASAMAWMLVVVLALFTAGLFASARFWVHYGDER
jgi:multiple sugar transport system permease protein